ncbi:probable mixed-linked glucan synthase 7 [Phragmites australis]|uniref:probable mixed-linked glucan synthase 7 n=1 Tax=Phragmites australis TaxID=29695 RepID=UPI002D79F1DA|nr:probable mixed-linked glucan synthase 7 [Phragmites australis]
MATTCMPKKDVCVTVGAEQVSPEEEKNQPSVERPLVRTKYISTVTIKLYRLVIFIRMGIFVIFFKWRICTAGVMSSTDGGDTSRMRMMWTISIAGELWFALMWVLDQLPKMKPVRRAVDVAALQESMLPTMDVFVTTADPEKEPPLATVNTVLSILAADYPADKLTCYVSDDGGALLTREAVAEAVRFAGLWVPFCRKHGVEPRNPEAYFSPGAAGVDGNKMRVVTRGGYKGRAWPELARDRRHVRREYEELRLRIDALQAGDIRQRRWSRADGSTCWQRGTADDHAEVVQVLIGPSGRTPHLGIVASDGNNLVDLSSVDVRLPALVYMCREKRHRRAHHRKAGAMNALLRASAALSNAPFVLNLDCDHYVNNSQALRAGVCLMLDRGGGDVAFVQFPQRFDGVDPADRYANHNRVFFDCTELGLDGIQGPIYVGTGCLFRRAALYGMDAPPRWRPYGDAKDAAAEHDKFSDSSPFLLSVRAALKQPAQSNTTFPPCLFDEAAIAEATALVSCCYEDSTAWGRDIGWIYGTVTEDVATGFCMHRRGWRSAYCATEPDAFRGTAPINLTDRLHQVLRWAAGSLEIFFSRNNPLLAGRRLHPLQRVAYLNTTLYPFTSLFLIVYCLFPAIPLLTGNAATGTFSTSMDRTPPGAYIAFLAALMLTLAMVAVLEVSWSGITLHDWWRNQQFWMVSATSAYLAAVAQVALKVVAGKEISFKLTSKQSATSASTGGKERFAELYAVRWTVLMVPPAVVLMVNVASMAAGIEGGRWRNGPAAVLAVLFNAWVVAHLYPFALGLMGRWSRTLSPLLFLVVLFTVGLLCFILQFHTLKSGLFLNK